ncbi:MAG: SpoVA/SpoVAEb family sporulation membrane protein [Bacilli bacterium]|nr:SpoVA/SpoVAEb family sporulation membrane protein [Bacilli bacterium]
MIFFSAFIFSGLVCAIAQMILDNTNLTPGHVTSLFTVLGAILSFLGLYEKLIDFAGAGATVLISNFGHMLYQGGLIGLNESGLIGCFTHLLTKASAAIVSAVVFSAILSFIFKPKD